MSEKGSQHTPGPWHRQKVAGRAGTLIIADASPYVCSVNFRGSIARTNADCNLIAAAPTMYEYLKVLAESGDNRAHEIIEEIAR